MCGRFTQSYTWAELVALYRLTQPALNLRPRYNIAPTTTIDVVWQAEDGLELVPMRWGLIPGWWKKSAKEVPSTFNARAETAAEKPMFRSAFRRTRCVVPALTHRRNSSGDCFGPEGEGPVPGPRTNFWTFALQVSCVWRRAILLSPTSAALRHLRSFARGSIIAAARTAVL
jgi:hypothetical protein